jgi:predicted nucleic acid-binding protein
MNRRMILVGTSVWRKALSSKASNREAAVLNEMLQNLQVVMLGPVRQELLNGINDPAVFHEVKKSLSVLDDSPLLTEDYETAARFSNICLNNGVVGLNIDFLMCAFAVRNNILIWTVNKDFDEYSKYLPIELWNAYA